MTPADDAIALATFNLLMKHAKNLGAGDKFLLGAAWAGRIGYDRLTDKLKQMLAELGSVGVSING